MANRHHIRLPSGTDPERWRGSQPREPARLPAQVEPDPGDGRCTRDHLTPAAREPDLAAAGRDVIALATQGITAASLATFDRTLADMATNVTATHLA